MRRQRKPSRKQREANQRSVMNARLRAERERGWPSDGPWSDETKGYVDLRALPKAAPVPAAAPIGDKRERSHERNDLFLRTGEVPQ